MKTIEQQIDQFKQALTKEIEFLSNREPMSLYEPVVYALKMSGKRIRPISLLIANSMYTSEQELCMPAALAIELFHNFTLLHDDMMDKAALRRNNPTVHIKYSENTAILSGDAMSIVSYEYLTKLNCPNFAEIIRLYSRTALEICEGQQLDMDFETQDDVTIEEYLEMIRLKTAVLLGCSLKLGAMIANAPSQDADALYEIGINLGLAFQLRDDYLDSFGCEKIFGKAIGGDITANKKTFLMIKAQEKASGKMLEELKYWISKKDFNKQEKIQAILKIYKDLDIPQETEKAIDFYYEKTAKTFEKLSHKDTTSLKAFAAKLMNRED